MKRNMIFLYLIFTSLIGISQSITGKWNGKISSNQFIFTIENNGDDIITTIDIPSLRIAGIKPQSTSFNGSQLIIDGSNVGLYYEGELNLKTNEFTGTLTEGVNSFPLILKKGDINAKEKKTRPQEPVQPYPYNEEYVTFKNEQDSITLAGTLTLPKGKSKHPVVVLISGSGPQDRDQTFSGHKTFWVLADYLTRQGIAVLRYDDRGYGKSTGNFATATTKDFSTDVVSAVNYLKTRKDIDVQNIGLVGHSEGGIVAPLAVNQTEGISFVVLLASTGIPGSELSVMQSIVQRQFPVPDEAAYEQAIRKAIAIASSDRDMSSIKLDLKSHYYETIVPILNPLIGSEEKVSEIITNLVEVRTTPWIRYFYNYNPADEIKKMNIPVLYLIGSNDKQVDPKVNKKGIKEALSKAKTNDYKIVELEKLNHLFQESETGSMEEYSRIDQTFSPIALQELSTWVLNHLQ